LRTNVDRTLAKITIVTIEQDNKASKADKAERRFLQFSFAATTRVNNVPIAQYNDNFR